MIFSRQEKASITLGISSLFTLVTISCKFKMDLTPGNFKKISSPVNFNWENKKWKNKKHRCKVDKI